MIARDHKIHQGAINMVKLNGKNEEKTPLLRLTLIP